MSPLAFRCSLGTDQVNCSSPRVPLFANLPEHMNRSVAINPHKRISRDGSITIRLLRNREPVDAPSIEQLTGLEQPKTKTQDGIQTSDSDSMSEIILQPDSASATSLLTNPPIRSTDNHHAGDKRHY